MNQPLGMDRAQAVLADVELTGIIADDHDVGQEAVRLDLPHSVASVAISIGSGLTVSADAEPFEMCGPGLL